MSKSPRPQWQLPPGVSRGLWDYAHAGHIADDYDGFFAENRLFELDEAILAAHVTPPGLIADLGCGTGRALVPLVRRGSSGLAVDLSHDMLEIVVEKADIDDLPISCVRGNLVELDFLADDCVDHAICMFATLGMIRGRENRQQALRHVRRILRPGGKFVLHIHNYWYDLYFPGGIWMMLGNLIRSLRQSDREAGDKFFEYRGIPNMFHHVFTRGEIGRLLKSAGMTVQEVTQLDPQRESQLRWPWFLGGLRANGWIIVCS